MVCIGMHEQSLEISFLLLRCYHKELEWWSQWLYLPVWNPVSLGNWIWWLLCLGWKVGSTRTNLLASQLRNTGELLEPLPALKQQQQKEKDWKTPLLSLLLSSYSPSSLATLIERYLHCKLKGPSRVAVLTLTRSPKMSTNSSNLITEGDLLQITLWTKEPWLLLTWGQCSTSLSLFYSLGRILLYSKSSPCQG